MRKELFTAAWERLLLPFDEKTSFPRLEMHSYKILKCREHDIPVEIGRLVYEQAAFQRSNHS